MTRFVFVFVFVFAGCAEQQGARAPSQQLLSAIGTAQALQHESDEREAQEDLPGAIEAARRVLDVPFPVGAAEREDVRLDAFGRIAELELARHDLDAATARATSGLSEATRDSYFRARLHVVLGRIHQERAARLRDGGDADGARNESEAAIGELEQSIAINRIVLGLGAAHGEMP